MEEILDGVPLLSKEAFDAMGADEKKGWSAVTVDKVVKYMPNGFVLVTDEKDPCFNKCLPKVFHFGSVTRQRRCRFDE